MKSIFVLAAFPFLSLACASNALDVGSESKDPPPEGSPSEAEPVDCSGVSEAPFGLLTTTLPNVFNVSDMQSDGKHLYIVGYGPAISNPSAPKTPDAADKMRTATVLRVPVDGGELEVLEYQRPDFSRGIVLDDENYYWASDFGTAIYYRAKSGGAEAATSIISLPGTGTAQTIATDGAGNILWSTWYGGRGTTEEPVATIAHRAPKASTATAFQTGTSEADAVTSLTVKKDTVYFVAGRDRLELRAAPLQGGSYRTLATDLGSITYALAADDTQVYGIGSDRIWRVAKEGGEAETLVRPEAERGYGPSGFAMDATHIYWADVDYSTGGGRVVPHSVLRMKKDGSEKETLLTGPTFQAITVDACHVYWAAIDDGVTIMARRK